MIQWIIFQSGWFTWTVWTVWFLHHSTQKLKRTCKAICHIVDKIAQFFKQADLQYRRILVTSLYWVTLLMFKHTLTSAYITCPPTKYPPSHTLLHLNVFNNKASLHKRPYQIPSGGQTWKVAPCRPLSLFSPTSDCREWTQRAIVPATRLTFMSIHKPMWLLSMTSK